MQTQKALKIVTSNANEHRGGRRYAPYAFTEQGAAMLSSVLRSDRAVADHPVGVSISAS
jgi:hypothetical protein